jgi:hypothetical protein
MYSYLLPSAISLPLGYNCKIFFTRSNLNQRIISNINYEILVSIKAYREGEIFFKKEITLDKENKLTKIDININDQQNLSKFSGYAELEIFEINKKPVFKSRAVLNFYSIYYSDNKKSFLSDNAYKYGSPAVINQISYIKKYLDAYPTITIDRVKDLGETIVLINPYNKNIYASLLTNDGRKINGVLIKSRSSKEINLSSLLINDEKFWSGHIQIKASNRIITFNYKHSFKDNKIISDYEHLDPFRGDPTFVPFTRFIRIKMGEIIEKFFG